MAEYTRTYPQAPTPDEIKQGYAPSTVRRSTYVKFLVWTLAGLAASYAISYGVLRGMDALEVQEQAGYRRSAARGLPERGGPRLQPSPGHDTLDWEDMDRYSMDGARGLTAKKLWAGQAPMYKSGVAGKPQIADQAVAQTAAAIRQWVAASAQSPTTKPGATGAAPNEGGK